MNVNLKCKDCGTDILEVHPNQRYCIPCRNKRRDDSMNKCNERRKLENVVVKPKKRKYPVDDITRINILAHREGISYGQYVQKHRL